MNINPIYCNTKSTSYPFFMSFSFSFSIFSIPFSFSFLMFGVSSWCTFYFLFIIIFIYIHILYLYVRHYVMCLVFAKYRCTVMLPSWHQVIWRDSILNYLPYNSLTLNLHTTLFYHFKRSMNWPWYDHVWSPQVEPPLLPKLPVHLKQ